ncbi:MAG: L,D-transpeptidase family protein [Deltaproteobacteria bacterium]|jgi:L,D-transpeptidase ErfK/SrfK|nr:L,D-transpeptidase family protein [Deltaproteobacteria bacterium]
MKFKFSFFFFSLLALSSLSNPSAGGSASIPSVVGQIRAIETHEGETLMEIARRTGFGYENVANANPTIDPWIPEPETVVILPGLTVLPYGVKPGLTINLAELRLFHVFGRERVYQVRSYPLGIGREGRSTPEGQYQVSTKRVNPTWRVPEGLREIDPSLPLLVRPGPDNPLGKYWMGLSISGYGIHGTNRPFGVGRRVSYGCLRMYPEQVAELYPMVAIGTSVHIVYQPVKAGWSGDNLFLEVHPDHLDKKPDLFQEAMHVISKTGVPKQIDYHQIQELVRQQTGIPQIIGSR